MNQDNNEQEWQQLQFRIKKFVDGFLKEDSPAIEHKINVSALLPSPSDSSEENVKEISTNIWA